MRIEQFKHVWQDEGPKTPVLVTLHGTGGDEHDLLPLAQAVAPGMSVLSPRGQVDENGLNRWFKRLEEGVFDLPDLKYRTTQLADWLNLAFEQYGLAGRPIHAIGYSNGANIAANLILQGHGLFQKAVLIRPMFTDNPVLDRKVSTHVALHIGEQDQICPPGSAEVLAVALESVGATVSKWRFRAGHNLTQEDVLKAAEFLKS